MGRSARTAARLTLRGGFAARPSAGVVILKKGCARRPVLLPGCGAPLFVALFFMYANGFVYRVWFSLGEVGLLLARFRILGVSVVWHSGTCASEGPATPMLRSRRTRPIPRIAA